MAKKPAIFLVSVLILALTAIAARAESLVIGVPSWPSARVTSEIIRQLTENEMGISVELRDQGELGILSGIDQGEIDVHPEIWFPNLEDAVERYAYEKKTLVLSINSGSARQNICATRQTIEMTGIENVSDLADPKIAAFFDSNGDGLGEMWIGEPTRSSANIERVRARSYGYDKTMSLLQMDEDVAMAAVDVAASLGKPIVFYCYSPHHVYQLHDILRLKEPEHDPASWKIVAPADDPQWLEHSSAGSAWAPSSFRIGYARTLESRMPAVAALLRQIHFNPKDGTWMSYQVQVERLDPAAVASAWIAENRAIVDKWLEDAKKDGK